MSDDRENQDSATAGDSLLKPDESKENVAEVEISESQALASPGSKAEVKYVNSGSQNGDAKIDIETVRQAFVGMGKEELMRFANDPFWVRTRWILFSLFWLLWLAMLVGAIAIIVLAPRCAVQKKAQWWERSPLYEVNVRSFKDGSRMADGIGDLQGMHSKLDYIKDLGVSGVILSSIFATSPSTSPESVTDFKAVHPDIGTMDELKELLTDMKARDLRLVLDLVPNHSGKDHKWFQDSVKKIAPYKDYYIWSAGKGGPNQPPNNWQSVKGGSAWEWNDVRNEFYLHQFESGQPDLNFRNPKVKEEFNAILKFWLALGVDGFQLRKTAFLFEDEKLQGEPPGSKPGTTHDSYEFYDHKYTSHLYDSFKLVEQFRSVVSNTSEDKILLIRDEFPIFNFPHNGEADNSTAAAGDLLQTPNILANLQNISAADLNKRIFSAIDRSPSHKPVWALGDTGSQRLASRFSPGLADAMMMVSLLLPGTPITLYGDELGLKDVQNPGQEALGPMPWDSSTHGGFTSDTIQPWIPIGNSVGINVAAQNLTEESRLKTFKELVLTRKTMVAVLLGKTNISVLNATKADGSTVRNSILAFTRTKSGNPGVLVAVNPTKEKLTVNFEGILGDTVKELTVHVKSYGFSNDDLKVKGKTQADAVSLSPEAGVTFTFVYNREEE
ncbi:probable maltase [Frankliniella occidentalis]|uniref:alpha-glucosidase n=1 Tax=Frankliniella occidentalis TaxID=133901 RepID=A0A6J1S4A0_FRAOC|nr:probable maltase [Frankliniella occidentalis]